MWSYQLGWMYITCQLLVVFPAIFDQFPGQFSKEDNSAGFKIFEILISGFWEIQKKSLPRRPSSQNWVKNSEKCFKIHQKMVNGFWFYSTLAGWSTWQQAFLNFSHNYWFYDTPDTPGGASVVFAENWIWNRLKQFLPVWWVLVKAIPVVEFSNGGYKIWKDFA